MPPQPVHTNLQAALWPAIDEKYASVDEFDLLKELSQVSNTEMPNAIKEILNANILHTLECDVDKMEDTVKAILEL